MPVELELRITPESVDSLDAIHKAIIQQSDITAESIQHVEILRKSLDARKHPIVFLLKVRVFQATETVTAADKNIHYTQPNSAKTCHIIGFGPAGIFAALQCLEQGIKPIVLERGKAVKDRISDISAIHKTLQIDPDSNYCFGEGGAGTYSDGKLYTRSSKRGDIKKVLNIFIQHGADAKIGIEAHPHIGTNKLPRIIENMRKTIIEFGGEVHFEKRVSDFVLKDNEIKIIQCTDGSEYPCQDVILATGHSARDIFELLHRKNILIEAKPFALGVRVEHTQELIDSIQYKCESRGKFLPPASYSLVSQVKGRGVFSFCMCPGGVIAPAGTANHETVVNGWSSSARNGPFSNSGIVVQVQPENWQQYEAEGPLAALAFQSEIEQKAFNVVGSIQAPAQRLEDFIQKKTSLHLPKSSYVPGLTSYDLNTVLPKFVSDTLREGFIDFGKKMRGYRTNEAIVVGVESRTSSPVRIPRDKETLRHPQIKNLFPCGEGAGYAGGIVSAAMDGIACALKL
ncbi:MAG: FAD-binding protein [Chitinophagales bacterium]|nr:FAD-binding protein [Chitinophagales bacterium]